MMQSGNTDDRATAASRPLSARSVMASLRLGRRPPRAAGRDLVRWCVLFGIAPGTARVALHRMTSAGEVRSVDGAYELAGDLARRQEEQHASLRANRGGAWAGDWRMALAAGAAPRPASVRVELRAALRRARLAEWREGVWIRPDNIEILEEPRCTWLTARPDGDPVSLAADLFAPIEWAKTARVAMSQLARATQSLGRDPESGIASAFLAGAQALRHVRADPLLPDALLPADWPGAELRAAYLDYERRFHGVARAWFRQRSDRTR